MKLEARAYMHVHTLTRAQADVHTDGMVFAHVYTYIGSSIYVNIQTWK